MGKRKRESLFEQMAVKGAKPDACGFVPFDPHILKAMGFTVLDAEIDLTLPPNPLRGAK